MNQSQSTSHFTRNPGQHLNQSHLHAPNQQIQSLMQITSSAESSSNFSSNELESNKFSWQTNSKRRRTNPPSPTTITPQFQLPYQNRYGLLTDDSMQTDKLDDTNTNSVINRPRVHKPPPIFIYEVNNYRAMTDYLSSVIADEQYYCKALSSGTMKINVNTSDSFRSLIKQLKQDNIIHHTYQVRDERAYRVVIRNIHHSVPTDDIIKELEIQGHSVRNILNINHRITKEPLPLFFVDLEPKDNNKSIYDIQFLCNMKIKIEPPNKQKNSIVQCTRCQCYGHTKSYCARPYACVKCGGAHNSTECTKTPDTPAKCALCSGNHTANYKGCDIYINLQKARGIPNNQPRRKSTHPHSINTSDRNEFPSLNTNRPQAPSPTNHQSSYSQIVAQNQYSPNITEQLTALLNEFKVMFNQLINQNSMVLNMLSTVVSRITK